MSQTEYPWHSEELLREMHHEKELCISEIARRLDCRPQTISKWLRRLNVEVQSHANAPAGDNHPNATDSDRRIYDSHYRKQSNKALERDGYKCQACGIDNESHKDKYNQHLHTHHVNEDDDRTKEDRATFEDLVTLCAKCHRLADKNGTEAVVD